MNSSKANTRARSKIVKSSYYIESICLPSLDKNIEIAMDRKHFSLSVVTFVFIDTCYDDAAGGVVVAAVSAGAAVPSSLYRHSIKPFVNSC